MKYRSIRDGREHGEERLKLLATNFSRRTGFCRTKIGITIEYLKRWRILLGICNPAALLTSALASAGGERVRQFL
jgi:hypothetical protein